MPKLDVYLSGGYYIGTFCGCGPYSRESGYYRTRELAQADLDTGLRALVGGCELFADAGCSRGDRRELTEARRGLVVVVNLVYAPAKVP